MTLLQDVTLTQKERGSKPDSRDDETARMRKADFVTEMPAYQHPWQAGIKARRGIEFRAIHGN
jgi:hypothetical protein